MSFLRASVNDNFWRSSPRKRHADEFQLELPLGNENASARSAVVTLPLDEMHGAEILHSIRALAPNIILDMREFPRFDISGASRRTIFNEIDRVHAMYDQRPLPWSQINRNARISFYPFMYALKYEILKSQRQLVIFVSDSSQREFIEREISS